MQDRTRQDIQDYGLLTTTDPLWLRARNPVYPVACDPAYPVNCLSLRPLVAILHILFLLSLSYLSCCAYALAGIAEKRLLFAL